MSETEQPVDTGDVALGVWQSHTDEDLQAMRPQDFYEAIKNFDLDDENAEEAWWLFAERRNRVFFQEEGA